jgi:hypothetical protein
MYIGTSVATEEQYANFLAIDAGDNPLLQVRPSWAELVTQGKVEDGKVAIMVYPEHVSYTRPSDLDAMHESGELQVVEDVYSTYVVFSLPGFDIDTDDVSLVTKEIQNQRDEAERALALLACPAVKLEFVDYDKHYGGSMSYRFETTDIAVAQKHKFEEVLRAGTDDFEQVNWESA